MSLNSEIMESIGREIVDCRELNGVDWVEVSAIFSFDDDGDVNSNCGFAYDHAGDAHPTAFLYDPIEQEVKRYRDAAARRWQGLRHDAFPVQSKHTQGQPGF